MADMSKEKNKQREKAARDAFNVKLHQRPKVAHRAMFQAAPTDLSGAQPLSALKDPDTGHVENAPEALLSIAQRHFTDLFSPAYITKTGKYLPEDRPSDFQYPWTAPGMPDPFQMSSTHHLAQGTDDAPLGADPSKADVFSLISDRCTYQHLLRHTGNNKQPGPDRVPNELLKNLPPVWHDTIHALFVIMWVSGTTPHAWKSSTTILLFKKNDPFDLTNYRPIGLANALYKLWTSVVAVSYTHLTLPTIYSV